MHVKVLPEGSPPSASGWDRKQKEQPSTQLGQAPRKTLAVETLQLFLRTFKCVFSGSLYLKFCIGEIQPRVYGAGAGISRWVTSPAGRAEGVIVLWEKIFEFLMLENSFVIFLSFISKRQE